MSPARSVAEGGFDDLPAEVAIVARGGEIVYTNRAWRRFAEDNDYDGDPSCLGVNYLAVCDAARDDCAEAGAAADGLRAVLAGDSDECSLDYPCHAPTEQRWFLLRAVPFESGGDRYALVMHLDITERKLAELRLNERNRQLTEIAEVLSSDLRGPLSSALRSADSLADEDGEAAWRLAHVLHQIDAIVETGTLLAEQAPSMNLEPTALREVAESTWRRVNTRDASFLVVDSRPLLADRRLLAHLFENLFATAIVRAGDTARVRVGTTAGGFYVSDDGVDVAHQYETTLDSISSELDGRRYGLATVARVATVHGWSVAVGESDMGGTRVAVSGVTWV